ncbi:hypothetical protein PSECIP111951_03041 [Pseudoalteromonas holothuriae]|uniref:Uncharacterized protein n=2 Tax=Pseudoalteromonas holothuriae TaxID=2963714 RepID=A0A9W4QZM4_9GAMM|nr:hypothetical protein PSECIP111854_02477 [Pseudoalteromonas sp. CIP111854]CAH9064080.1 hypothetical protein PSECIP111951_03041 [Pseudoalteromonas sp. CIP111951]
MVLVIAQSDHQPNLNEPVSRNYFLQSYPKAYYSVQQSVRLEALSESTIEALLALNLPEIMLEWSIRLAQRKKYSASQLYWRKYYDIGTQGQRTRLQQVFVQQYALQQLKRLERQFGLPSDLQLLLASEQGVVPQSLSKGVLAKLELTTLLSPPIFASNCKNRILLISDHFSGVKKLESLKAKYLEQPEPMVGSYCLSEVFYIGDIMSCYINEQQFARCDEQQLIKQYNRQLNNIDYVIMMTKVGQANVANGIMTLTSSSNYQVFLHELMHFSGFEDEYAIAPSKARWLCRHAGQHAPNLIVAKQPPAKGWYKSETCKHGLLDAFKLSKDWSIMQFQELPLSHQYRQVWQNAINSKRYQIPRFTNLKSRLTEAAPDEGASEI